MQGVGLKRGWGIYKYIVSHSYFAMLTKGNMNSQLISAITSFGRQKLVQSKGCEACQIRGSGNISPGEF